MDVDAVSSLSSGKGKGSSSPRDGVFKVQWSTCSTRLQCTQEHRQAIVWQRQTEQVIHGSRVRAKVRAKRTRENPKENPKEPMVPKVRTRAKHRKLVSRVLKTRNQRQARTLRNLHRHVPLTLLGTMVGIVTNETMGGVLMNGMMTGVLLDGTKVGNKCMTPQAHFHLEFWMSVPPAVRSGLNG